MTTTIEQGGINFTIETGKLTHVGWDKKYTNANNVLDGVYDPDPQNIEKSINAVEIDWNGAMPGIGEGQSGINTTGDLLNRIKYIYDNRGRQGEDGKDGEDGITPHIGTNGNWYIGDTDTSVKAQGEDGKDGEDGITPHIENNYWYIGNTNTNVKAQGPQGETGNNGITPHIENDYWYIGDSNTHVKAKGVDGTMTFADLTPDQKESLKGDQGISPHIGTGGYWYIGDSNTDVKAQGDPGDNGITPHIGTNGNWYIGDTDTSVKAQGEDGKDGEDGITPHIGTNGNWYIGNNDTNVQAQGPQGETGIFDSSELDNYLPKTGGKIVGPLNVAGDDFKVVQATSNGGVTVFGVQASNSAEVNINGFLNVTGTLQVFDGAIVTDGNIEAHGNIKANGNIETNRGIKRGNGTNSNIFLDGGGVTAVSSFATAGHSHDNYITNNGSSSNILLANGGTTAVSSFATKSDLDKYLSLGGGTVTGALTVFGQVIADNGIVSAGTLSVLNETNDTSEVTVEVNASAGTVEAKGGFKVMDLDDADKHVLLADGGTKLLSTIGGNSDNDKLSALMEYIGDLHNCLIGYSTNYRSIITVSQEFGNNNDSGYFVYKNTVLLGQSYQYIKNPVIKIEIVDGASASVQLYTCGYNDKFLCWTDNALEYKYGTNLSTHVDDVEASEDNRGFVTSAVKTSLINKYSVPDSEILATNTMSSANPYISITGIIK